MHQIERVTGWLARRAMLASALAYTAIAAAAGRHVLAHPASTVVHDVGDPVLTAAILHWNAWMLPLTRAWWQFPIFAPTPDALAFSEPLLGLSVVATPIAWLVRDPVVASNLVTLLTYPLCGVAAFLLARRVTGSAAAAFLAGLAFAFAPYRAAQLPHVQMLAAFWAPLALLGLHAYDESGRRGWLALFAGAWLLQALANLYSLYLLSALVALWVLWFVIVPRRWTQLRDIAVAAIAAALPLAPILYTYLTVHARNGFARSETEAQVFSADLTGLLCASPDTALWGWLQVGCRPESALFPGLVLTLLAGVAIVALRRDAASARPWPRVLRLLRAGVVAVAGLGALGALSVALFGPWRGVLAGIRISASDVDKPLLMLIVAGAMAALLSPAALDAVRRRSVAGFYLFGAFAMWLMALGPTVVFMGVPRPVPGPFRLLFLLPGGGGVRAPGRFWLMATLCLAIVTAVAARRLLADRRPWPAAILTAVLSIGLVSDGWGTIPAAPAPAALPDEASLRDQMVLVLPVGYITDLAPQFRAVVGGWRSVNGYSGYEAKHYEAVRQGARFEADSLFEPFRARGDLYVVVSTDEPRLVSLVERQPGSVCVAANRAMRQYRSPRRRPAAPPFVAGASLPVMGATGSCTPGTGAALDGHLDTRWVCGPQQGREWFMADLGTVKDRVSAVRYTMGESYREFPRRVAIDTSVDGAAWDTVWEGDVIAQTIEGSLSDPLTSPTVLPFAPRPARYVRLRQTATDDKVVWALPELAILAAR
jgi:hypothetical protein